ncbi:putative bifunctional diguanylate cyclase/phosphodiesterase [Psychrobacter ciconiae]|uniref:putative bifunctional diguanylate cyclase/phosphodiesterase n=1 Tax=Psychrobacter ciconiae TaxID=1553449 RepID=UPI00191ACED0|nr:GGDEF domain-containing phosphodiesterase [Psychrobacter ciconiae]
MITFNPISTSTKQALLTQLCENFDDAILILDAQLRYVFVNPAYEILMGYDQDFLLGRPLSIYNQEFLSVHEQEALNTIIQSLSSQDVYQSNITLATRYEQKINCQLTFFKAVITETNYYVGVIRDKSVMIEQEAKLNQLSNYNQLTGLPNRKVFLTKACELLNKSSQEVVIIRLNIDRYRMLLSTLGADTTNFLIQQFAERIQASALTSLYCFAHFGGDDFGLLFEFADANLARNALNRIMQICECPFVAYSHVVHIHVSVGVSYFPDHGKDVQELMIKAERALWYVKQQGGDDVCWYRSDLNLATSDALKLETELRAALTLGQFVPYYQPKMELATGKIIGFEALVRWQHPKQGMLTPAFFIDAIAKYKLSFELFCQMASQIIKQLHDWQQLGLSQHICINADAAEFSQSEFFDVVKKLLDDYQILGHQLHIEITESSLMLKNTGVKSQLKSLKDLGVCLALDDFGTGYASLSYLQEFPFDFIKIDQSFISKITVDPAQMAIVKAILDLAKALDMKAVAEGIETKEQRDALVKIGCSYGQGFLFSRAVTAEIATQMLLEQEQSTTDDNLLSNH